MPEINIEMKEAVVKPFESLSVEGCMISQNDLGKSIGHELWQEEQAGIQPQVYDLCIELDYFPGIAIWGKAPQQCLQDRSLFASSALDYGFLNDGGAKNLQWKEKARVTH